MHPNSSQRLPFWYLYCTLVIRYILHSGQLSAALGVTKQKGQRKVVRTAAVCLVEIINIYS